MRLVSLALASLSLLAQSQAGPDLRQPLNCWPTVWSKVPEPLKTALASTPPIANKRPPMEILVRMPPRKAQLADEAGPAGGAVGPAPPVDSPQPEQALEPKALFAGKALEVYSRTQARAIGEGLISPWGAPLKFNNLWLYQATTRSGVVTKEDDGSIVLLDAKGYKWPLRFFVVGTKPASDWMTEPLCSEECQKLQGFILAGEWPMAFDAKLRKAVRKTSPNEPLLLALDLLEWLERPAGKEELLREAAARLAALLPRNPEALSLSAAAYLAAGTPESAGRLRAWIAKLKPAAP